MVYFYSSYWLENPLLKKITSIKKQIYKFEGKYERNQHWFDLDDNLIDTNFRTRDTDSYNMIFQNNIEDKKNSEFPKS